MGKTAKREYAIPGEWMNIPGYDEALELMNELVSQDPAPNTEKADQISILATLMEEYEKNYFPLDIPSAVDAIKFRMDQLDLKPIDLVQYLGSASRVSEILSGKRSLTVDMINSLSAGLGIPEKALLKKDITENEYTNNIPASVFEAAEWAGVSGAGLVSEAIRRGGKSGGYRWKFLSDCGDTDILIGKIIAWGRDKKLNDARAQLNKVTEELGEIAHEICRNRYHSDEMIDAVGDTLVTIIILADICKLDVKDCLQEAYNVINKRTGKTVDGTFVKDE